MKTLIVMGDTHGDHRAVARLLPVLREADYAVHLGDYARDAGFLAREFADKLVRVEGNCDGGESERVLEIEGAGILVTHGHRYGVKEDLTRLVLRLDELGLSYAFFGHTHAAGVFGEGGKLLVNPGSLARPLFGRPSYAFVTVVSGKLLAKIVEI